MSYEYITNQLERLRQGEASALPGVYSQFYEPKAPKRKWTTFAAKNSTDDLTQSCAQAVANFMRPLDGMGLIRLRESFAQYTSMEWYADWRMASAAAMEAAIMDKDNCFYVLALGTFHPNGYFRQRCLEQLVCYGGQALPYTLMLVNNWVEVLREQALAISLQLLETATTEEIVTSFVCLERVLLGGRRRQDASSRLYNLARKRLLESDGMPVTRILNLDRYTRRLCYRLLLEKLPQADQVYLLHRERDGFGRLLVAKRLLQGTPSGPVWAELLANKSAAVRRLAVQARCRREPDWDGLEAYLFDPNASLREYTCFALRKRGGTDIAQLYRECVATRPCAGAILGLGENGTARDAEQIRPFLTDARPAFRKAALTAIATLTAGDCAEFLYKHLACSWSGKTAFRLILRGKYRYAGKRCYQDYLACADEVLRYRYFRLLLMSTSWEKLPWLIRLYPKLPEGHRETGAIHLQDWQAGYLTPNQRQRIEILSAMRECVLPGKLRQLLEFSLRASGHFPEYTSEGSVQP